MEPKSRVLIFGATGSIGSAIAEWFLNHDWDVSSVSRSDNIPVHSSAIKKIVWDPFVSDDWQSDTEQVPFNAIVWAQGKNFNDSIYTFNSSNHEEMYRANVTYILKTLHKLLLDNLLCKPSRLCILSSIWQNIARQNKLSYTVSKAAIQGLVQSLAIDLGKDGHLVNAVLPGALDTPMTRANLNKEQMQVLESATPLGNLATLDDVCNLIGFLCSCENTGITSQFIAADRGFTNARIL